MQVKLKDLYQIRHPWAPNERPQAQGSAGAAGALAQGAALPEAAAAAAAAPGAAAAPLSSGDNPDAPSSPAPALMAARPVDVPLGPWNRGQEQHRSQSHSPECQKARYSSPALLQAPRGTQQTQRAPCQPLFLALRQLLVTGNPPQACSQAKRGWSVEGLPLRASQRV